MRIVAVSDTHGEHRNVPYIPDGDIFIHAGDFLNFGQETMIAFGNILGDFYKWLEHLPHKHKILVGGNHDHFLYNQPERIKELPCTYLQDASIEIEGFKVYGTPWVPRLIGMGVFDLPRFGMDLVEKYDYIPEDVDILISHGAPYGCGDVPHGKAGHVGSEALLNRLENLSPKVHIFGHIHAGGGFRKEENGCIFANVAYCRRVNIEATIIDI